MKKLEMMFWLIFILSHLSVHAQTSITGKVTDKETGEEMIGANIVVKKNGIFVQGESTDIDGNFNFRVEAGVYDIEVSYTGYQTEEVTDIIVEKNQSTKVDVQIGIGRGEIVIGFIGCCHYWMIPLIRQDETTSQQEIGREQIRIQPTRNIKEISLSVPGVSFSQ